MFSILRERKKIEISPKKEYNICFLAIPFHRGASPPGREAPHVRKSFHKIKINRENNYQK